MGFANGEPPPDRDLPNWELPSVKEWVPTAVFNKFPTLSDATHRLSKEPDVEAAIAVACLAGEGPWAEELTETIRALSAQYKPKPDSRKEINDLIVYFLVTGTFVSVSDREAAHLSEVSVEALEQAWKHLLAFQVSNRWPSLPVLPLNSEASQEAGGLFELSWNLGIAIMASRMFYILRDQGEFERALRACLASYEAWGSFDRAGLLGRIIHVVDGRILGQLTLNRKHRLTRDYVRWHRERWLGT